jgi:hypothetical protein
VVRRSIVTFQYETPLLDLEVYRLLTFLDDLEVYRLLTILEASPALAEFKGRYASDRNRVRAIREWEFPEISGIVVSLAAIIRSAVDSNPGAYRGDLDLERPVGVLMTDTTQTRSWESLEFREACNKILHADRVELEREPETDTLTGELILEGRYRGKDWQARLDLREYALGALVLTP